MQTRNRGEDNPIVRLRTLSENIVREQERWIYMRENGCNDPFWSDGFNLNLTRNHIIHDKTVIDEICSETDLPFPAEYYITTPPEVDDDYMANLEQKKRVERLKKFGGNLTNKCPAYDPKQLNIL